MNFLGVSYKSTYKLLDNKHRSKHGVFLKQHKIKPVVFKRINPTPECIKIKIKATHLDACKEKKKGKIEKKIKDFLINPSFTMSFCIFFNKEIKYFLSVI